MKNRKVYYSPYQTKNDIYHKLGSAAVLFILILGICFVCFEYHTQTNATKQYLNEVAKQAADRINIKISKDITMLELAAKSFAKLEDADEEEIAFMLKNEFDTYTDDSVIRISYVKTNGKGIEVHGDGEVEHFALPPETGYFKEAIADKKTVSSVTRDPVTQNRAYVCAVPIIRDDEVVAVHHGVYMLSKINSIMNADYFESSGYSYVIQRDGTPVFYGNSENGSSIENDDFFNSNIEKIKSKLRVYSENSMVVSYCGQNYWITYKPVGYSDWVFVLVVPNSSINNSSDMVLIFSAMILLSMLITSILFLRHMDIIQADNQNVLYELACIDEVTGLYNKTGFSEFMNENFKPHRETRYAFVYLDIDNFKAYNDIFGYSEGDKLLRYTADAITNELKDNECCARFNGDNFFILLGYKKKVDLEERLEKIMNSISQFSDNSENSYDILSHCGVYQIKNINRHKKVDFYVDRAKMAVESANKAHKNEFIYYDDSMRQSLVFKTEIENDLKQGIENGEFKVYVQPKYSVETQKLAGGEALIRWEHPTKGFLTPNKFVDVFEKNGQITEIDFFVLEHICKMQHDWREKGHKPIVISVNQSRMHFFKSDYLDRLNEIIKKYDADPNYIELEITETVALSNTRILSKAVNDLHGLGFRVSIDDFGSGQSSLNVLKDLAIDVIKLDRGFFISLTNSPKGKEIIATVIAMASRLNIETVSEGIETDEQFDFIKKAGCDLVQGFLFGKPMPEDKFSELFLKSVSDKKK